MTPRRSHRQTLAVEMLRELGSDGSTEMGLSDPNLIVRAMPLLRAVPYEELAGLPAERVERRAGEAFFLQGSPSDATYGILTGRLRIMKAAQGGREFCLEVLGPGDLVGAVAVVRKVPMPAGAVAVEPTACLRIPADAFRKLMERHPAVCMRMLELVSRRLIDAGQSRVELATEEVEVRLARALLRLADKFGSERSGEIVFSQSLTRQSLGDLAGTTVESTIRVMSRWTRAGVVRSAGSRITIEDPDALKKIAGDAREPGAS